MSKTAVSGAPKASSDAAERNGSKPLQKTKPDIIEAHVKGLETSPCCMKFSVGMEGRKGIMPDLDVAGMILGVVLGTCRVEYSPGRNLVTHGTLE